MHNMKNRVVKLQKISRYFEQKKIMKVVDLQKASRERSLRQNVLDTARSTKEKYINSCIDIFSGTIDLSSASRFHGERRFHGENVERERLDLDRSLAKEKAHRDEVVDASTTHRIWERVVEENQQAYRKHREEKEQKTADDLALVHLHLGTRNR